MKLQIAFDEVDSATLLQKLEAIHDVIDIVEVGTPLMLREGMATVRKIKEKYPHVTVLADIKIMDGGALEAADACDAGADIVTVLAVSDMATIRAAADAAHERGKKIMADLICIEDVAAKAAELDEMGLDYICIHTGVDMQARGVTPLAELAAIVPVVKKGITAVAGGINLNTIEETKRIGPGVVVAGGFLNKAPDLRAAVLEMKQAMQ